MLDAIKAQCFRCNPANVTNEMLAAFVSVAAAMDVNPFLPDMLYAFPGAGGSIIPIMGPSGVYKKLMEHPDVDSWETIVYPEDVSVPPTHAVTKIWRKGRERPLSYTALLSEWKMNSNPQWTTRPRHFLSLRSLKHAARQIIHGLPYDADDRHIMEEINVTNTGAQEQAEAPARPAAPPRAKKGAAAVAENPKPAPAIDIQATTTTGTTATTAEPAKPAEPAKAAVEVAQKAEAAPDQPHAFLKDGETLETTVEVIEVSPLMINFKGTPTASVSVLVKGGFNTPNPTKPIYHIGGATGAEPDLKPLPIWAPGAKVRVALLGKLTKAGNMMVTVSKAEQIGAAPVEVE